MSQGYRHGRIWIINQWLPPHPAPTAVLAGELAHAFEVAGWRVLRMSRARADDPPASSDHYELDRVQPGTGMLAKLAAWPRFAWRGYRSLRREAADGDCLIVTSDPPLYFLVARFALRGRSVRFVHWSQDVYPEIAIAHWPALARWLAPLVRLRDRALGKIDRVVAISPAMAERFDGHARDVVVIPNWTQVAHAQAPAVAESRLRREHFRGNEFVVMYSGNLGRVHEFDTLVGAALKLRDDPGIRFLIVGEGPRLAALKARVAELGLGAFSFLPLQAKEALADSLAAADVHYVSLRTCFDGLVLPSKLYGIAAAGRPVVFCGKADGEAAGLLARHGCGLVVAEGDVDGLMGAIRQLRDDAASRVRMGHAALELLATQGTRDEALRRWADVVMALQTE
jgi:glycosyltransferase involved in cell wall biosynthesis